MLDEFLSTPYGILAFIAFDIIAAVIAIAITYRWLFKRFFDILFSGIALILLSPALLFLFIKGRYKVRAGELEKVTQKELFIGKKGKKIYLHRFTPTNDKNRLCYLLRLADIFTGRLSFIGCKPFRPSDAEFLDEAEEERHIARPGLINPLVLDGDEDISYDDMIEADRRYARRFGLFTDIKILLVWLLKKIRGEGNSYLGKTRNCSYAEDLFLENRITKEDFSVALSLDKEE